jgi:SAM-dependent methyltransferase
MQKIHQQGKSWYFNQRRWADYGQIFGKAWQEQVLALKEDQWWLDSGAGSGAALIDYLAQGHGRTAAIGYALDKWDRYWVEKAMEEFKGRFDFYLGLLETPLALWPQIPQATLLTDLYGPLAYTHAPDLVLQQYAHLLKPHGKAYLLVPAVSLNLRQADGQGLLSWHDYFGQGQGWLLLHELTLWPQQDFGRGNGHPLGTLLILERTEDAVKLPALLAMPTHFKFNIPPRRTFKLRAVD